jgi:hypothetical protein
MQQTVPASFATLDLAIDDHDSLYIPGFFLMFFFCMLLFSIYGVPDRASLFRLGVYTQVANCTLALVVEFASR